ncbi:MAG: ChbG/HpnK family deacetylase [Eubacteriales bacterium]|nr:ChbG/HpnK family deacetylase [Eubacteriales bacterium]
MIINADDFGQTESCTRAIFEAFEKRMITDVTMVANGEALDTAFELIRNHPAIRDRVGIHFILTEGIPLTETMKKNSKFVTDGRFNSYFKNKRNYVKRLSRRDKKDIYEELTAQIDFLLSKGILISHADSHHHVHNNWQLASIIFRVCREHSITRIRIHRNVDRKSLFWNIFYAFLYNSRLGVNGFSHTDYFGAAGEYEYMREGISEIMVHPDYDSEGKLVDRKRKQYSEAGNIYADGEPLEIVLASCLNRAEQCITYKSV